MKLPYILLSLLMPLMLLSSCEKPEEQGDIVGSWSEIISNTTDSTNVNWSTLKINADLTFTMSMTFKNDRYDSLGTCFNKDFITEYAKGTYTYNEGDRRLVFVGQYCDATFSTNFTTEDQTCYSFGSFNRNYSVSFADEKMLLGYRNGDRVTIQYFSKEQ